MYQNREIEQLNYRLTSLWALSEVGGSLLNTFKLPFSGLLITVCTVWILALFFYANQRNTKPIAIAFLVVALIKLAFNPFGSPLAFLALFFEVGFCMTVFLYIRPYKLACVVAAIGSVAYACWQQLCLRHIDVDFWSFKTAFLPTAMWDRMILELAKSNIVFEIAYILLFLVVGLFTGKIAGDLPELIEKEMEYVATLDELPKPVLTEKQLKKKEKKAKKAKKKKEDYSEFEFPLMLLGGSALLYFTGKHSLAAQSFQFAMLWLTTFTDFFQKQVVPRVQHALTQLFYPQYLDKPGNMGNFSKISELIKSAWLISQNEPNLLHQVSRFVPLMFALGLGDERE